MRKKLPTYRLHKPSGRACVTLVDRTTGRRSDVYLGTHGTPESRTEYDRVVAAWLDGDRVVERPERQASADAAGRASRGVTVATVLAGFYRALGARYEGGRSGRLYSVRAGLRVCRSLYGKLPPDDFGPKALRKCRDLMVGEGWKRGTVNSRTQAIVAAFKWGVSEELVAAPTWQALTAVAGLRKGEQGVSEDGKTLPVPLAHVDAIKAHVAPQVWALIQLQLFTGARGGELAIMRACDLTTTGKVWEYRPTHHKGSHRNTARVIYVGPRAQQVIKPYLAHRGDALDNYLFNPREGHAERKAAEATKGKPRRPGQKSAPRRTGRRIGDHYTAASYRRAIERACTAAGVPDWHPHQLRHTAATEIRREFGLEAASLVLGHGSAAITDATYAERDSDKAKSVILKVG